MTTYPVHQAQRSIACRESEGRVVMELSSPEPVSDARNGGARDASSVASSLEHLVTGGQGVISKRIDLALLEGQEMLARSIERALLIGAAVVLSAAAWFAGAGAAIVFLAPDVAPVIRLAAFAALNAAVAFGLVMLAARRQPPAAVLANGHAETAQSPPPAAAGRS